MADAEFTISREDEFPAWFDGMLIGTAEGTADVEWYTPDGCHRIVGIHFATATGGTRKLTGRMDDGRYRALFNDLADRIEASETFKDWVQNEFADDLMSEAA